MNLDPRRLQAFLKVAEEQHFSRAAVALRVSQPALSQQIRVLERELGVTLFERTSQRVDLTPAGEALVRAAPRVLFELDRAADECRQAARGVTGLVTLGSVRTGLSSVVPQLLRTHTQAHPQVRFDLVHMDTSLQLHALGERTVDLGIVRAASERRDLVMETLVSEPLMIAVPAEHALAREEVIEPRSLQDDRFIMWPRHLGSDFFDLALAFCRQHGLSPQVLGEANDVDSQLALVAAGFGVSLQPAYYATARPQGVLFKKLAGPPPEVALQLAWRRHGTSPHALALVETARALFVRPRSGPGARTPS